MSKTIHYSHSIHAVNTQTDQEQTLENARVDRTDEAREQATAYAESLGEHWVGVIRVTKELKDL